MKPSGEFRLAFSRVRGDVDETYAGTLDDASIARVRSDIKMSPKEFMAVVAAKRPPKIAFCLQSNQYGDSGAVTVVACVDLRWSFFTTRFRTPNAFQEAYAQVRGTPDEVAFNQEHENEVITLTVRLFLERQNAPAATITVSRDLGLTDIQPRAQSP
jgi:hypothetical protein